MIAELFLAAIAALIWANIGDGPMRTLAFNVIFVASISTLLFNLNPLLRFDGYYILSDLLEIPNLQARSTKQVGHWVDRYAFGLKKIDRRHRQPTRSVLARVLRYREQGLPRVRYGCDPPIHCWSIPRARAAPRDPGVLWLDHSTGRTVPA
jgi:hypothetical protein